MKSVHLIFGTYNCQPVGTEKGLFERSYQRALKPFLSVINRFPKIPVVLHYSGPLLEWIDRRHPEFLMLMSDMVNRTQVELLTGGYYEPVLPLIPNADKLGQIEKLTTYLRGRFGKRPRGHWLTERIWEPSLASTLCTSGIEYTFIPDEHLQYVGLEEEERYYPYITEDQGKTLVVFPLSDRLKQFIPHSSPEKVLSHIIGIADESNSRVVSLIDDGMRWGWEGDSHRVLYEEKWLERFLELIQERKDIILPISPGRYVRQTTPRKKVYFPTTTYAEMMGWLTTKSTGKPRRRMPMSRLDSKTCSENGLFRHFLTRYPESNLMYSKMMYVHLLVNQIRGDKYRKKTAREELWKGQFHRAYWHDKSGGIYLNNLRKAIYHAFIEAEKMTRSRGGFIPSIVNFDFDMDGKKEYLYQGRDLNAYVHSLGGMIFELDFLPTMWNYEDTLCRRPEAYHDGAEGKYDWYLRRTFIDHFFSESDSLESFSNMSFKELGDFVDGGYELQKLDRDHLELVLQRTGTVSLVGKSFPLKIEKGYRFRKAVISVDYTVTNLSQERLSLWFGNELNLSFASDEKKDLTITKTDCEDKKSSVERGVSVSSDVKMLLLQDLANKVKIEFQTENGCSLWSLPIETISRSSSSDIKRYQSTCLVPNWHLALEPGGQWRNSLRLGFSKRDTRK